MRVKIVQDNVKHTLGLKVKVHDIDTSVIPNVYFVTVEEFAKQGVIVKEDALTPGLVGFFPFEVKQIMVCYAREIQDAV